MNYFEFVKIYLWIIAYATSDSTVPSGCSYGLWRYRREYLTFSLFVKILWRENYRAYSTTELQAQSKNYTDNQCWIDSCFTEVYLYRAVDDSV